MLNLHLESSKWLCYMMGTWGDMKTQREGSISSWTNNFTIFFRMYYVLSAAISWFSALNLTCIEFIFYQKRQPSCMLICWALSTFDLRFISCVTHQTVAPFHFPTWFQALGHIDPSFRALGSSCLHPWKLTAGTPSMQVWFRWFSRTKEVIFRSYVSFRGGVPPKCSAFKSEFTPLPNHQSPINAALTLQLRSSCGVFFRCFASAIPAIFFAQPSFEDRFLLDFPWPKGEAWASGFCWN